MSDESPRVCLFGCALDTGNLGVSALGHAVLDAILRESDGMLGVSIMDHSPGHGGLPGFNDQVERCGCRHSRRYYRPETLQTIGLLSRLWKGGGNFAAVRLRNADAVLDISGGDSFTDLYGERRFRSITLPKLLALRLGRPLVLLPQTYGPFDSDHSKAIATRIVRGAAIALARDARSFAVLRELLGDSFDPARHRCGVDVAFLLPAAAPEPRLMPLRAQEWLADGVRPVAGVNISGLIHNDPRRAREDFGFVADYRTLIRRTVEGLIARGARVLLIPHVVTPPGHYESDVDAAQRLVEALPTDARDHIMVAPAFTDPREVKGLIGKCDWFCGTRMHSTIAALSQGVPTAAVAYSIKTQGVFETCGQGDHVADPRHSSTEDVVAHLLASFDGREAARASLAEHLPDVRQIAQEQMSCVVDVACARIRTDAA
ncbi:MAG: polysaccharide pyruvyl transferase family protein [Phycisphaerales bacterium JB054]